MITKKDKIILYISSLLLPIVGLVLFVMWIGNKDTSKRKVGINSLIISLFSFITLVIIGVLSFYNVDPK
uniref:Uncharacterized protein n=1 Tax=Anaerobacillus isosaccharinicus TaxID=1532552 RepID=A0A1S2L1K0_9BACI